MAANIPVTVKAIVNDLPKIKAQTAALNAEEKRAIKEHLSQVSFQRRLENEINRELKEQISSRRRLQSLSARLDRDLAKQAGGSARGGLLAGAGTQLLAGAATLGITAAASDFVKDSFQMAAASERLEKATHGLGRQFGLTSDEIIGAIKAGSENTISSYDAMLAANKALLFGIVENEEQFEDLTKIAVGLGRAMGMDAKQSLDDLTTGIGRQSRLILDNLGLIVNSEEAYKKYADQLGKTVEELTNAEKQQAFTNAALEQGREKLKELGDQELDTAGKIERLTANWADFQTEFGKLADSSGIIDGLNATVEKLMEGAKAWQFVFESADKYNRAIEKVAEEKGIEDPVIAFGRAWERPKNGAEAYLGLAKQVEISNEEIAQSWQDIEQAEKDAEEEANKAAERRAKNQQLEAERQADREEAAKAAEEEAKRLEKVADIRERSIRQMLDIDEQFAEDTAETWEDWREDQEELFEDYSDKRADILKKAGKDALKIEQDLAKDIAKVQKDLAKDLAKITEDENKKITELKEDAAKEEAQAEKKRQIDALADERLFQFDLQQLAAEGSANAIKEALERRAIEEEIEAEKTAVDDQIAAENLQDEIDRTREDAEAERAEAEAAAAEKVAELEAEAEEERMVREAAMLEALEAEKLNFEERSLELQEHRRDKLAQLEQDRIDTIAKIGQELTEIQDVTKEELAKLVPIFHEFGDEAGNAFADGLSSGYDANKLIEELTGQSTGAQSRPSTTAGRSAGFGSNPGTLSFAEGGIVPGPLGSPQLAVVHGGETIMPVGQAPGASVSIVINNPVFGNAVSQDEINGYFQQYTDTILAPALG